ncbi:MAG: 2-isopropylmalate synthase [Alphaproteobacteria bacterium]
MTQSNNQVIIFDTTLRDGEQSPGAAMSMEQKLAIALQLEKMGVDVIEAGFPISSNGDFEAVQTIARAVKDSTVCGLARAARADIERAAEAVKPAARGRIHTFISTSPQHIEHILKAKPEDVLEKIRQSVELARNLCDDVEWSAMDATRSDRDFLCRAVETAIKAGAQTINIPDTVGYTLPTEYTDIIKMLLDRVPDMDKAVISVHCHNDLGLAVANSLAGVMAGARQVECTINGLGERAGNAALEEVVMAMRVRNDLMPFTNHIKTEYITRLSRLVSSTTGFNVQPNKAIVGANAFAHESGIHQDGMLKNAQTYEIMSPESVGLTKSSLKLGKLSGRAAFKTKLKELGYELGDNALEDAFHRFKELADAKRDIWDEDIIALVDDEVAKAHDRIKFVTLSLAADSRGSHKAAVELSIDGEAKTASAEGTGPVDAIFNAIRELAPHQGKLSLYQVSAVTEGTDAQAEATVRLDEEGRTVSGQGTDHDTLVASARAYIHAVNKLMIRRLKSAPPEMETRAVI